MRPESRGEMNQEATKADRNVFSYFQNKTSNNVIQGILWFMDFFFKDLKLILLGIKTYQF